MNKDSLSIFRNLIARGFVKGLDIFGRLRLDQNNGVKLPYANIPDELFTFINRNNTILEDQTCNENIGTLVVKSGSTWVFADGTTEDKMDKLHGIYLGSNNVLIFGLYTTTGLTEGATYYVGSSGNITDDDTYLSYVKIIGHAVSETLLWINPESYYRDKTVSYVDHDYAGESYAQ